MPEIALSDVAFAFANEQVLSGIQFDVNRGEFVTLLGASGCGKSTLLRLIAGLIKPTSGTITFDATQIGFVFQKPTLCPWLNVQKNIELPLELNNAPQKDRAIASSEAIELVGLRSDDALKYPHQLSGGMQMRVSLARALVAKPRLMLMDEPFSALDEVLRQQLAETCLELCDRESWTTVFVTHNVSEAVFLSQRIHILAGKPAKIVDTVEVPFTERSRELRAADTFARLVSNVSQRLRDAVEADGA